MIRDAITKCYGLSHHYQQQRRERFRKDMNEFVKILDKCNCESEFHRSYTKQTMLSMFESKWFEECNHTCMVTYDVVAMSKQMKIDHITCYIYAITGHKCKIIYVKNTGMESITFSSSP
jgi:hypothetical protein